MRVGKVYRYSSNSFAFLTMKIIFKKFEILTASRLGMSQNFHAKTRVISCSSKKYWFFDWGTTRILSFGSPIWCEFLKRQSLLVFSQNFLTVFSIFKFGFFNLAFSTTTPLLLYESNLYFRRTVGDWTRELPTPLWHYTNCSFWCHFNCFNRHYNHSDSHSTTSYWPI